MAIVIAVALIGGIGVIIGSKVAKSSTSNSASTSPSTNGASAGSNSTSTTRGVSTTTQAPTTTVSPASILLGPTTDPAATQGFAVATELANALAGGDWVRARQLEPAKANSSDGQLASGYGNLVASTPVLVWSDGAGPVRLRLGLVADESGAGGQQTSLYCVTWVIDLSTNQVSELAGESSQLRTMPGQVDPLTLVDELRAAC